MTHVKQTRKSSMIYNLHASQNIVRLIKPRRMGWAGHIAHKGEMRNAYIILAGKPGGKRPLGRPRHRWEDNAEMNLKEIDWKSVELIHLTQDRGQW